MSASSDADTLPERPKRGRPKLFTEPFYPELPEPTGEQVRDLRVRMGWTLSYTAGVVGLTDSSAVSEIERGEDRRGTPRRLNSWRWTLMLLAAGEHPTLVLSPRTEPITAPLAPTSPE
ncbi:helix-turn-helix domain-containing protein [uncultured Azohydromonas sp.]|jgi:hypothetical protein|uniref:helix-turn-helix domain-containing protein n=1 Tax=uncultured Azohydromonas sp. TaxID=487342 RepID=UPI002607EAAD|nr:helix-turn-helix domain-containing protein [uncultured Azohydromonas sp.]